MARPPNPRHPDWVYLPATLGVRAALAALATPPLDWTLAQARRAARTFATSRFNRRHFGRAIDNLAFAYPDWDAERVREHAILAHEHLASVAVEFAAAPRLMNEDGWTRHVRVRALEAFTGSMIRPGPVVLITGHVGNWELLGFSTGLLGFPMHALYRPLDWPPLDRWLRVTRARRGVTLVDKFGALRQLPDLVAAGAPLGFVADQNGGDRGVFVPFLGRLTSTYKSIGLLALQSGARVVCVVGRRLPRGEREPGTLGFVFEGVDAFGPADWATHPDPLFYITARYRWAIERMIRRSPDQYFWMHRIWRSRPLHERQGRPFPPALREKLGLLPWMTPGEVDRLIEVSARDADRLARTGERRFP